MKKRMHKLCTILTASALLAMSVTVYAAEGDNTEAGFQPAEEGTVQSANTEQTQETASEQTEEKDPEENGLDSFIYIREKEDKTIFSFWKGSMSYQRLLLLQYLQLGQSLLFLLHSLWLSSFPVLSVLLLLLVL